MAPVPDGAKLGRGLQSSLRSPLGFGSMYITQGPLLQRFGENKDSPFSWRQRIRNRQEHCLYFNIPERPIDHGRSGPNIIGGKRSNSYRVGRRRSETCVFINKGNARPVNTLRFAPNPHHKSNWRRNRRDAVLIWERVRQRPHHCNLLRANAPCHHIVACFIEKTSYLFGVIIHLVITASNENPDRSLGPIPDNA